MHVPDIIAVKEKMDQLKENGLIAVWELPYENILTRRSAALFFLNPVQDDHLPAIWDALGEFEDFGYKENIEKKLSQLTYCITFSKDPLI